MGNNDLMKGKHWFVYRNNQIKHIVDKPYKVLSIKMYFTLQSYVYFSLYILTVIISVSFLAFALNNLQLLWILSIMQSL